MRKMMERFLRKYGSSMSLIHNDTHYVLKGFLQPGKSMSQRSAKKKTSPLGEIFGETYLYIGPLEYEMQIGDTLWHNQKIYDVRQVETVLVNEEPIYMWGLCVLKGGADEWC